MGCESVDVIPFRYIYARARMGESQMINDKQHLRVQIQDGVAVDIPFVLQYDVTREMEEGMRDVFRKCVVGYMRGFVVPAFWFAFRKTNSGRMIKGVTQAQYNMLGNWWDVFDCVPTLFDEWCGRHQLKGNKVRDALVELVADEEDLTEEQWAVLGKWAYALEYNLISFTEMFSYFIMGMVIDTYALHMRTSGIPSDIDEREMWFNMQVAVGSNVFPAQPLMGHEPRVHKMQESAFRDE